MKKAILFLLVLLITIPLLTACGEKCTKQTYLDKLEPIYDRWNDVVNEAQRVGLDASLDDTVVLMAEMTNVLGELEDFKAPKCAKEAHEKMVEHIVLGQRGFFEAWGGNQDNAIRLLSQSMDALEEWEDLIEEIE